MCFEAQNIPCTEFDDSLLQGITTLTFDCYGTLIDWESGILSAVRSVIGNSHLTDDQILHAYARAEEALEGGPYMPYAQVLRDVMRQIAAEFHVPLTEHQSGAIAASLPSWKAFPDTVAAMHRLRTRFKLGVISNIDDDLFAGTQRTSALPIDWLITAQQCGSYKPSPNNFRQAMAAHHLTPATMLHVAESLYHDIAPCRALGIRCIWVHRRHGKEGSGATFPAHATPSARVTSMTQLATLLHV